MADVTSALATLGPTGWVVSPTFTKIGGRRYGASDVAAPVQSNIRNLSKIAGAVTALKNAGSARATVVLIGHSVADGVGSDGTTNTSFAAAQTWRTAGMAAKICDALNAAVGGAGSYGIETLANPNLGYFTLGGSLAVSGPFNLGGVNGYLLPFNTSTNTASFTVGTGGTAVKIYGYTGTVGTVLRYQINGGSVQTAAAAVSNPTPWSGGSQHWYDTIITGLTAGDTVTIVGPTVNTFRVYAVDRDYKTVGGITLHRNAFPGLMGPQLCGAFLDNTDTQPSGNWVSDADKANYRLMQAQSLVVRPGASLVIAMSDINDIKAFNYVGPPNQAWGWSLATIKQHKINFNTIMANLGLPVLDIYGPLRDPNSADTAGTPYTQADIIQAYKEASDVSTNCAYFDLTAQYTGATLDLRYAAQMATGMFVDTVHPNAAGHIFFGGQVSSELIAAMAT